MTSVADVLDMLAAGEMTVDEVAVDFAELAWPKPARPTVEDGWMGHEVASDPDSWATVSTDSRLDPATYQRLADAAFGGR